MPTDEPSCPLDQPDNMCWYCTGEKCAQCDWCLPLCAEPCEHDVIDRHKGASGAR